MRPRVDASHTTALSAGWEAAATAPDRHTTPDRLDDLDWSAARVPGTAAGVLADAGRWRAGDLHDFDSQDWWFRTSFKSSPAETGEEVLLLLEGIATVSEVFLNGEPILQSDSMFATHALDVGTRLREINELAIRCRALGPLLRERRRPRQRWRTRLVAEANLRFFRTMLLGRTPGFAPGPAAVGPWRPVFLERRRILAIDDLRLHARIEGGDGVLAVQGRMRLLEGPAPSRIEVQLHASSEPAPGEPAASTILALERPAAQAASTAGSAHAEATHPIEIHGEVVVTEPARWWPHTHGDPTLYEVRLLVGIPGGQTITIDAGHIGFRNLRFGNTPDHDVENDGLALHVNDVPIFARGAVWTPVDPVGLAPSSTRLRAALELARDAGMNLVRLPGTSVYEDEPFHDLCDELGMLVWQDMMFANLDYPISDPEFAETVRQEATRVLGGLAAHPSLAVVCGNSEIEQQVAMLGLDPQLGRGELFGEILPQLVREAGADAVYLPSAPCGGDLPFRPSRGVSNYYGVGGYRRPLEDARRAEVRFAAECLAFSNVPDEQAIEEMLPGAPDELVVHHPRWKAGVPRDTGTGWDFEDVRDHYLKLLFGVDPAELRRIDHGRYLDLSRAVTGEAMAAVFGEWRRTRSPCGGGLVLWMHDLAPGAGWGVVDHRGEPKVAYHHLRRALAPVAVWATDEGLGGILAHVANDRPTPLSANLRVAFYRDCEQRVGEGQETIELAPHGSYERDLETLLGHFVDASWAYRFGPPAQDLIVVSLEQGPPHDRRLLSQAVLFPAGRPTQVETLERVGLRASAEQLSDGSLRLEIHTRRLADGVRVLVPGFDADDDALCIEPGGKRVLRMRPRHTGAVFSGGMLTALNLDGRAHVEQAVDAASSPSEPALDEQPR